MRSHFFRFYILILLAAILLFFSFGHLYKEYFSPPIQYNIEVEQVFYSHQAANPAQFLKVLKANTYLPKALSHRIDDGEIIAYAIADELYYLRALDNKHYLQWGPIKQAVKKVENEYVFLVFYSVLAVVFLLLLRPLFRDLAYLQNCALEFGKNPQAQPLTTPKKSSIYPLAYSLFTMSNQLIEFVELNKDLARIIAHEVRTPLARMRFVLQRIENKIEEKHLSRMLKDISEIENIATEYLEFSRSQHLDEHYFKAHTLGSIEHRFNQKYSGLTIPVIISSNEPNTILECNISQLELAISNLINNALRYAEKIVQVDLTISEGSILISVQDDGPGFSLAHQKKANEGSTTGFGLGLYLAEKVITRHQGEINIGNSTLGGAEITVKMPLIAHISN